MNTDEENEYRVYKETTQYETTRNRRHSGRWTLNLIICCLTVATGSLQFGYNISAMNSVTPILKEFIHNDTFLFADYHNKSELFKLNEQYLIGNETKLNKAKEEFELRKQEYLESLFSLNVTWQETLEKRRQEREREVRLKFNMSIEEYLEYATRTLEEKKTRLESFRPKLADGEMRVGNATNMLWTATNSLFVVGGMTGTFASKFMMDKIGRKSGILVHHVVGIVGAALVLVAAFCHSPVSLMVARLLYGVQGGMSCTFVPTYLAEISPASLRGQTGVIHQLCITVGILMAQLFGLRQILGTITLWPFLLAMPIVFAVVGSVVLLLFLPETPRALISKNRDSEAARKSLRILRNTDDVDSEIDDLMAESKNAASGESSSQENVSIIGLFKSNECRWAIITAIVLHVTQQFSGINAIFYYSSSIFEGAGIPKDYIQYAILSTGIVNVLTTIVCVPLIDRLGRKPLLVFPMIFMIIDFIALIVLLTLKGTNVYLSYLSILCIMLFVISFAIGLGPIPFIYTAECFRQNARSSAMSLSTFFNWTSGLVLTLGFPFIQAAIQQYVFCIFAGVIAFALVVIFIKVPETKGKSIEEIIEKFTK